MRSSLRLIIVLMKQPLHSIFILVKSRDPECHDCNSINIHDEHLQDAIFMNILTNCIACDERLTLTNYNEQRS